MLLQKAVRIAPRPTSPEYLTVGDHFLAAVDHNPGAVFLQTSDDRAVRYGEAMVRVAGIVRRLGDLGVRRGDALVCYLEEQEPMAYVYLACALAGVRPAPCSSHFSTEYVRSGILDRVGARYVFALPASAGALARGGCRPVCLLGPGAPDHEFAPNLDGPPSAKASAARELLERARHGSTPDDVFIIASTSGSTGKPKLVVRQHRAFSRYAEFVGRELVRDSDQPHRFLMAAALTHSVGQHMLTTALSLRATMCIPWQLDTGVRLHDLRKHDPTVLPLVPRVQRSLYKQYLAEGGTGRMLGPSAQYVCSSGAEPDARILSVMKRQGLQIIACYASTEASMVSVTPRKAWRPHYSGKIVEDVEWKLAPDQELLIRSPGLTPGYLDDDELNRTTFDADGFYKTGDFAEITRDGYIRILGRKRDVLNTPEGSNIYPERIENLIEQLPWAQQVVILGDQRPFLVAMISVHKDFLPNPLSGSFVEMRTDMVEKLVHTDGFIEPDENEKLYASAGRHLARINQELEKIERIARFALFDRAFEPEVYVTVGTGKVRRNRKTMERLFADRVQVLYNGGERDVTFVPGIDRRLRARR